MLLVIQPGTPAQFAASDDILGFIGPLLAALVVLARGYRLRTQAGRQPWGPPLLAGGILCFAVGDAIWAGYEQLLGRESPFPSWADAAYLLAYPCLLIGIALLPAPRLSFAGRVKLSLDSALVILVAGTFSWFFLFGPLIAQSDASRWATLLGLAYPAGDLVLLGAVLLLWTRAGAARHWRVTALISAGLVLIVVVDSLFEYLTLHGGYVTGNIITDQGWVTGYLLVALGAAAWQRRARLAAVSDTSGAEVALEAAPVSRLWLTLAPYALLPPMALLGLHAWRTPGGALRDGGVLVGSAAVLSCVLLRQVLALVENWQLHRATAAYARRLDQLATTDPLTEAPNHRALVTALDRELERAQRAGQPCGLLFLDLDHFKALNDAYGHTAGDAALREFASVARGALRAFDVFGRWGGEEFLAILPDADLAAATGAAERVRAAVASWRFGVGAGAHLTCSIGVACVPDDASDAERLVSAADDALAAAKRLGRNQVRVSTDPAVAAIQATDADQSRESAALVGSAEALAALVAARDQRSGDHTREVAAVALQLAVALGLTATDAHLVSLGARLHDIGKVSVPDVILHKPGPLNAAEWAVIRTHPRIGADVVGRIPALRALAPLVGGHHERWDGGGYPDGLAGGAIPLGARIIAVADAYVAMCEDRPYRAGQAPAQALTELRRMAGTQFDPAVVAAMERVLEVAPPRSEPASTASVSVRGIAG